MLQAAPSEDCIKAPLGRRKRTTLRAQLLAISSAARLTGRCPSTCASGSRLCSRQHPWGGRGGAGPPATGTTA